MVDLVAERQRLEKELANAQQELQRTHQKLNNEGFVTKAPAQVVEKERSKFEMMTDTVEKLTALLQG